MRILHAPSNIANQPWTVAQALRARRHTVEVWHYGPNPYGFPCDRHVPFPTDAARIFELIEEAVKRFDVFHFHFARSLVPREVDGLPALWDLPLLRALGKKVFVTFRGSDVRRPSLDRNPYAPPGEADEASIAKRLHIFRAYADGLFVSSPTSLPFVPEATVSPRAILLDHVHFVGPVRRERPVVLHVPTNRAAKGTEHVERAVATLRQRGIAFEFRLLENLPHKRVLAAIADADIVVDQLLIGDYGNLGIEAMAMGKAVVVRLDDDVLRTFGGVPAVNADPTTIVDELARIMNEADERARLGKEARAFVEEHHAPGAVAAHLEAAYAAERKPLLGGHPDWATLAEARRLERAEEQLVQMRAQLEAKGRSVVIAGTKRGPFSLLGTRIDEALRGIKRGRA